MIIKTALTTFLVTFFLSLLGHAADLKDVKVLDIKPGTDNYEIQMQVAYKGKSVQFSVDIVKSDPEAFSKLGLILKKVAKPSEYRIDLRIPSFSYNRNGSYYLSPSVVFIEPLARARGTETPTQEQKAK